MISLQPDTTQRLAAANAAAGWGPFTPAQQRWIDRSSERLAELALRKPRPGEINRTDLGKALCFETIEAWNQHRRLSGRRCIGRQPILRPGAPSSSVEYMSDPWSMTKLLCIVARWPKKAYPIDCFADWRDVVPSKNWRCYFGCDIKLSANCGAPAFDTMPLVCGEYVSVHKICDNCNRWFYAHDAELVEMYREDLDSATVEPTNEARRAELLKYIERRYPPTRPDLTVV